MRKGRKLSYANVVATLALFIALGGGAYAAAHLQKNSVGTRQLKKSSVATAKIKTGAVNGEKVLDGSLTGADLRAGTIPTPPAPTPRTAPLKSGETITGVVSIIAPDPKAETPAFGAASFQIPPPGPIPVEKQHIVEEAPAAGCPGVGRADPGNLCVYRMLTPSPIDFKEPRLFSEGGVPQAEIGPYGFLVGVQSRGLQPFFEFVAVWAYTAP